MVAPVPFSSLFTFSEVIKAFLNSRNLVLDEYNIEVNKETLFKRYKNYFTDDKGKVSKLIGVDFVDIRNDLQELIAICWYGYRDYSNISLSANDIERGIRIRTKNISIGDETTCNRLFNVEKTNQRFIGEIHTLSDGFIPNARRDYFNENATCQQFEKNARVIFKAENLENRLAQTASKLHNKLEEIQQYRVKFDEFRILKGAFESEAAESFHLNKLKELEEKAIKAKAEIDKIKVKANEYPNVRTLYKSVIGDTDISVEMLSGNELQVSKYDPPEFTKLSSDQRKVVIDIFEILEEELDFYLSELIKKKIVDKYN
jgi:molecular chaperone HtpG